jgi:hypothetical protein
VVGLPEAAAVDVRADGGVPKGYQLTPDELATIHAVSELQFPLKPRRRGAVFDGFVSNLVADRFSFEELTFGPRPSPRSEQAGRCDRVQVHDGVECAAPGVHAHRVRRGAAACRSSR